MCLGNCIPNNGKFLQNSLKCNIPYTKIRIYKALEQILYGNFSIVYINV